MLSIVYELPFVGPVLAWYLRRSLSLSLQNTTKCTRCRYACLGRRKKDEPRDLRCLLYCIFLLF